MQQHAEAKRAHPDAVLFFRLGDFYEMFGEDAVLCSKVLDLTLTSRNKGKPDEIPMAGVPHHAAHGYVGRLLGAGYKVAICEQMADPKTTRGIVPREVVRVITPGTVTHEDHLRAGENSWLGALEAGEQQHGLALFDVSTGELLVGTAATEAAALAELSRTSPQELLLGGTGLISQAGLEQRARDAAAGAMASVDEPIDTEEASVLLGAEAAVLQRLSTEARLAGARVLRFARACNPGSDVHPLRTVLWEPSDAMLVDATAQAHLEIVTSASGNKQHTLLGALGPTSTAGGARLLRKRLLAPLKNVARIRRRLDRVEAFVVHSALREALRRELAQVTDLERLSVRSGFGEANPRDLGRLRDGLGAAGRAAELLSNGNDLTLRETLGTSEPVDVVADLEQALNAALVERPPAVAKEGAIFRPGFDRELDELDSLRKSSAEHTRELESRLREELDVPSLKVRYTRVFGWYVEVSRAQVQRVPSSWRRKQTVASGERYSLSELDELAARVDSAQERHRARELSLLRELADEVRRCAARLVALARVVAEWDCSATLAEVAHQRDYSRPEVDDDDSLEIRDGRHPVVEQTAAAGRFVPNDVSLHAGGERLWVVTGPNMAGKSTLLRQTAQLAILAQMGSYVPARHAHVGTIDRVLSRVGASDNLARGESTFMVEMRETADILLSATRRSLVILDEIGRGTSTFDGLAIAWAVAEHLAGATQCRALFATHYHELTTLAQDAEGMANYSVSAREIGGDIVFLHRLVHGPANRSYGVAVAKLAGLPPPVLRRADELLTSFENGHGTSSQLPQATDAGSQLELFHPTPDSARERRALERLREADVNQLNPLQALALLAELKATLAEDSG